MAKTRVERLRALITSRYDGNQSTFASAVGKSPNYISRLLGGTKRMGEDFAREVETLLKLPPFYMDGLSELPTRHTVTGSMAERLMFLRESRELMQEALAQAANVELAFVQAIENGVTDGLELQPFLRLCSYFNCNPHWLAHGPTRVEPVEDPPPAVGKRNTSGTGR
jgi:transcriptional regulator with XRE-family HTH domain